MYDENRRQRIARIIELAIPTDFFDLLEDLASYYGSQEKAILEAIKAHHKEQFGSLDDTKVLFTKPSTRIPYSLSRTRIDTPVTEGKLSKIIENGKKFDEKTLKSLEKVDDLINKLSELPTLQQLQAEISSMKSMLQNIDFSSARGSGTRRAKVDLSALSVDVAESDDMLLAPPDRPSLESVLDSMLLFDDEDILDDEEQKEED